MLEAIQVDRDVEFIGPGAERSGTGQVLKIQYTYTKETEESADHAGNDIVRRKIPEKAVFLVAYLYFDGRKE